MKLKDLNLSLLDEHYLELARQEKVINVEFIFTRKRYHDRMMKAALKRVNNIDKPVEEEKE